MWNNERILKLRKHKALLENQKKFYWFPIVKKKILDAGISSNPDEYVYDILWGESVSRIVRDEEGVEETEKRDKEEREKREEEREREERERINKYKNMETIEIIKRSKVLQKINHCKRTEEENKELASLWEIYASRLLISVSGRRFKRGSGDKEEKEGKDYIIDDVGVIWLKFYIFFLK